MPADDTLPEISARHSSAADPYPCHARPVPPGSAWGLDYGYCRTSLDALAGAADPRCPRTCPHKAPADVVEGFTVRFFTRGAMAAAQWAREQRNA